MFPVCDVIPPRTLPVVTLLLAAVHALAFIYQAQLEPAESHALLRAWGVIPAAFAWPQLITSLAVHHGFIHFASNLLVLWLFGSTVEDTIGRPSYLLVYVLGSAAGAAAHVFVDPSSAVPLAGGSAGAATLMGYYVAQYPRSQVLTLVFASWPPNAIEVPAVSFIGLWLVFQLFGGVTSLTAPLVAFVLGAARGWLGREREWND